MQAIAVHFHSYLQLHIFSPTVEVSLVSGKWEINKEKALKNTEITKFTGIKTQT